MCCRSTSAPPSGKTLANAPRTDVQLPPRCGCGRRRRSACAIRSCKSARPATRNAAWVALPPLDGANLIDRRELKPNAEVLAEADDVQQHPLLVAGQSGDGRVLAFAGDSTWHWQMQGFGDAHRRFWRQCVLWLAKKD